MVLSDPLDELYPTAVQRLRHWCQRFDELPASCTLDDLVNLDNREPISCSALSDVYCAEYLGAKVAVKVIRLHGDDREAARKVSTLYFNSKYSA
jgi:predicted unusual protein kinase regulating ubiquinone biosynthesis (AarF/ABC1/UbiB family)